MMCWLTVSLYVSLSFVRVTILPAGEASHSADLLYNEGTALNKNLPPDPGVGEHSFAVGGAYTA